MPRVRDAHTSFYAGELSPLLAARSDRPWYRNGAEKLTNRRLLAQGGTDTRPATRYLATLAQTPARIEPFIFNDAQEYEFVYAAGQLSVFDPDGVLLTVVTGCPWTADQIARLSYVTAGDTTFVVHPEFIPQVVKRTGFDTFTIEDYAFEVQTAGFPTLQPYYKYAAPAMTMTPDVVGPGAVTLTLSGDGAWTTDHVGVLVRYKGKECLITAVTSATVASATALEALADTTGDINWDEAMFSTARGWPVSVTIFGSRLIFGGAASLPGAFCATKTGAYYNFDVGTALDDEAIVEVVGAEKEAEIRHVVGDQRLLIFTDIGVFLVPTSDTKPLTPSTIDFRRQTPLGSDWTRPQPFDDAVLYVQKTGKVVREAAWDQLSEAITTNAVSLLCEHLIKSPSAMAVLYGTEDRSELYAHFLCDDGTLSVFHSIRTEKITAWSPWETTGTIKSVCTVGTAVYMLVERELIGGPTWCLEKFDEEAAPLDCSKKVTVGTATREFTGFDHLAGQLVRCVSKGHYLGETTVSPAGVITLEDRTPAVTELEAGLGYDQIIRPMPADFDLPDGAARGLMKRLIRAIPQIDRSAAFRIQGSTVLLDFQGDDFATPLMTKTGQAEFRLLGVSRECQFDIVVDTPSKVTVLGLTRDMQING